MRKIKTKFSLRLAAALCALSVLLGGCSAGSDTSGAASPSDAAESPPDQKDFFKGIWISQFDLEALFLDGGAQRSEEDFTLLLDRMLENCRSWGFGDVFMQVHPYGDSFYASGFFPWSDFVTGEPGGTSAYDPLSVAAKLCEKSGLRLHAWINPLRLAKTEKMSSVYTSGPIADWYKEGGGQVSEYGGRCYLIPAFAEVRALICRAARELCENYGIAGVHIDDYFYPTDDPAFDSAAYGRLGDGKELGRFRSDSVSALVRELFDTVKSVDRDLLFGVSPAGNPDYARRHTFADVDRWCSEPGFADYVVPQLYFGFEHGVCPFAQTADLWKTMKTNPRLLLYAGLTLTKAGSDDDKYALSGRAEWSEHDDVLLRSLNHVKAAGYDGVCVFSYSYLADPLTGVPPAGSASEAKNLLAGLKAS